MKEKEELKKEIEAVLFASGRKVKTEEIATLCNAEKKETEEALKELKQDYEEKSSPLLLTEEADGYKLTVREKYLSIVKDITPHTELNRAMMETLAVIAWKQPVMQAEVIKIRTSNAYDDIRNLVEMGFISKEKHGRTFILKPTGKFFEYFDLPSKDAVREVFKDIKDVEPETQEKLDAGEKIGDMDVYESSEKKEKSGEEEPKQKLGGLDVFTEPEEEETDEEAETEAEPEEEIAEEPEEEETDEEKAKEMIHKLAEEDEGTEESAGETDEEIEKPEKETQEPAETEEKEEIKAEDKKESKKQGKEEEKSRLPKELEEFAGINEKEKKKEE